MKNESNFESNLEITLILKVILKVEGRWDSDRLVFKVTKLNKYKTFVARRALEPLLTLVH